MLRATDKLVSSRRVAAAVSRSSKDVSAYGELLEVVLPKDLCLSNSHGIRNKTDRLKNHDV
jgi:hypothetical protein